MKLAGKRRELLALIEVFHFKSNNLVQGRKRSDDRIPQHDWINIGVFVSIDIARACYTGPIYVGMSLFLCCQVIGGKPQR